METLATRTHDRNPMAKSKSKAKASADPEPKPAPSEAADPSAKPKAAAKRGEREELPEHVLRELAAVISEALTRRGWNPYRLSREARVDYSALHKFLNGKRALSMTTYCRCLDALGVVLYGKDRD